ncbi:MAG: reverse transcriptase domain-containing protein [Capsulimonadaceae bacterium]
MTAAGFLTDRVKGGSARESVVDVEGVLMLPESLRRRLDSIRNLSRQGKRINGLFRLMLSPLLWEQAYAEIAPNRGALTRGVTDNTLDGFSLERVHSLISRVGAGTYRFTPVRRVYIPKPDGKKLRPLGVPTADDKLVQGVVKLLLEAIYEPVFSPRSHGFRRNRSCHTALQAIGDIWTGVKWLVDIDVVGFFDNIDHGILLDLLRKRIDDERFIRLIAGMLKAGYMEDWTFHATFSGTPQGGVASPILANIYLHELDEFLSGMKARFDRGKQRAVHLPYQRLSDTICKRRHLIDQLLAEGHTAEAEAEKEQVRELRAKRSTMPAKNWFDTKFRRLLFCRYADDFLIGVIGSKADAQEIMQEVAAFLRGQLRLEASAEKSKVSKASDGTVFLGYRICTVSGGLVKRVRFQGRYTYTRSATSRIRLVVPHDRVVRFNRRKGYGDLSRLKAIHRRYLVDSSVLEIVLAYNAEMRGLANYYRLATCAKYSLRKLHFLWQTSLLKTLSFKLRRSVNQVAHHLKIGDRLAVRVKAEGRRKERLVEVFALKDLGQLPELGAAVDRLPNTMWTSGRSDVLDRLHSRKCEYCGAAGVPCEVHHAHKLKDVKDAPLWQQVAAARRRKRTVLCRSCHQALHAGTLTNREQDTEMRVRRAG